MVLRSISILIGPVDATLGARAPKPQKPAGLKTALPNPQTGRRYKNLKGRAWAQC